MAAAQPAQRPHGTPVRTTEPGHQGTPVRGLAFIACPPQHFVELVGQLRASGLAEQWDLITSYEPQVSIPPGFRLRRRKRTLPLVFLLWWKARLDRYRTIAVACTDSAHVAGFSPLLEFVSMLPSRNRWIIDRNGRAEVIGPGGVRALSRVLLTTALLVVARMLTRAGLRIFGRTERARSPRGTRAALLVPVLPDLSHTFVYREVLELKRRHPEYEVLVLESGDRTVIHREAAELAQCSTVVPRLSINRYLFNYILLWLKRPSAIAGLVRYFRQHTPSFGPGAFYDDPYCFIRIQYLHHQNHLAVGLMLADFLRRRDISYLHVYGSTYPSVRALVAHRLLGVPFSISTFVDFDYVTPFHMLEQKFGSARFVVTCTEFCARRLRSRFPALAHKFIALHHALRRDYAAGKRFRPRDGQSRLVYVGRFVPKKGIDTLIDACAILNEQHVEFTCHLYGDGELRRNLETRIAGYRLERRIFFEGQIPNERFYSVMNRDDLFVCPSRYMPDGERDGIPVTLLEAMAGGITVVATPVSGIPELIEDGRNGYLVAPDEPARLAALLKVLILEPARREQVTAEAQATVRERFSIERSGAVLDDLISRENQSSAAGR